jgi:hypothetical protein
VRELFCILIYVKNVPGGRQNVHNEEEVEQSETLKGDEDDLKGVREELREKRSAGGSMGERRLRSSQK